MKRELTKKRKLSEKAIKRVPAAQSQPKELKQKMKDRPDAFKEHISLSSLKTLQS